MIDRRVLPGRSCEIEPELAGVSDSQVVLNFGSALTKLYPHLVAIRAHSHDSWDFIIENLSYGMLYDTFSWKYGIPIPLGHQHKYGFSLHCYRRIHHIECVPKKYPLSVLRDGKRSALHESEMSGKLAAFVCFGDIRHARVNGVDPADLSPASFDFVQIALASTDSGYPYRNGSRWVAADDVEFTYVAETFDQEEHAFFRDVYADAV